MTEPDISKYQAMLSTDFPDLEITSIKTIGSGWHHDAVEVNGSIVFRIPRGVHEIMSTVDYEVTILKLLEKELPVEIPAPLYVSPKKAYFGYQKVGGVLLKDLVKEFTEDDWLQLKSDWIDVARAIHKKVSVGQAQELHIPDFIEPGPSAAERIFDMGGVDQEVLAFATKTIKASKDLDLDNLHYVFIHNDLQFHNIIANPKTKRISGLIDWTDSCIGPLAREFSINEWMKPGLLEEVANLYEQKTGIVVNTEQAMMWRSLEELGDYVESTEAGDLDDAKETMGRIKNMMALESGLR